MKKIARLSLLACIFGLIFLAAEVAHAAPAGRRGARGARGADAPTSGTATAGQSAGPTLGPWLDANTSDTSATLYKTFFSEAAGQDVSYQLFLPPGYEADAETRYPVVYWLHGRGGSQHGLTAVISRLEEAMASGEAPRIIFVGVNGRRISSYVDAADGTSPVQTMLVRDLIAHIDSTYRTIPTREARGIEGFSMGGAGAPKVGFQHPDVFGVVSVLGGALHDLESIKGRGDTFETIYGGSDEYFEANSPWNVVVKNADAIRGRTVVRIGVGALDNLLEANTKYHELLDSLGIEHEFHVVPEAGHNAGQVLDGIGEANLEFYRRAFGGVDGA